MTDIEPYQFDPEEPLQDEDDSDCFEESGIIEERTKRTMTCVYVNSMTSEHLNFLFPTFESGIQCSRNGGPPLIWIISLYL